ncbi:F-box domain, cyclin-like protein [Tanacetum coccineum]
METRRNSTTSVGFSLLPSELIHYIILRLAIPDIFHLKSVNKFVTCIIRDQDFAREYNIKSSSTTWLFVYKKRWHRDPVVVHGITRSSDRWFKVMIGDILKPVIPPGEDVYFLTASGNFFLFALNCSREVISVNPMTKKVTRIPHSPLGPRGTSSWRRSGIKLLAGPSGSGHFRFLFAEMVDNSPTLFEYDSRTNNWKSMVASENNLVNGSHIKDGNRIFLSASNGPRRSVVISVGCDTNGPIVVRPIFSGALEEAELGVGFSWGSLIKRLHIYGDGRMLIVRSGSESEDGASRGIKVVKGVELWGLSPNGRQWTLVSNVPNWLIDEIKKPYGVMMGCLEEKEGTIRAFLMSNFEGVWDIIWLSFDIEMSKWGLVPLPEFKMEGSNMAGVTFSSGLTIT